MTAYRFTQSAREDLIEIWPYTQESWGEAQADDYQDALHLCCARIAASQAPTKPVPGLAGVRAHHCRHHYLFVIDQDTAVVIVAVLHERMNLIERLRNRL